MPNNYASLLSNSEDETGQKNEFFKVSWLQQKQFFFQGFDQYLNFSSLEKNVKQVITPRQTSSYNLAPGQTFTGQTLSSLNAIAVPTLPFPNNGYWSASFAEDANGRITASDVTIAQVMPSMGGMTHFHDVFKKVEFLNVALTLEFKTASGTQEQILYFDQNPIMPAGGIVVPVPSDTRMIQRYFGSNGDEGGGNIKYQAGLCKTLYYLIKCGDKVITVIIDFSYVFCYPNNDFEPGQVIMANKVYPQITFCGYVSDASAMNQGELATLAFDITPLLPAGLQINTAKVTKYHGRIKMVVNNNSAHHLDLGPDGEGNTVNRNYLPTLRAGHNIPDQFEIIFKDDYIDRNIVGLFTDSNQGMMQEDKTEDDRLQPNYVFNASNFFAYEPSPFWYNAFDYANYDSWKEKEFIAAYGKDSDKFAGGSFADTIEEQYKYPNFPENTDYTNTLKKVIRQGAYDNIHLHGYLGHYKDNQRLVIHAPICGYCCFHMHWRWSALGTEIAGSRFFSRGLKGFYDETFKKRFMGWDRNKDIITPQTTAGYALIPWNQTLKIAITHPDAKPFNDLTDVVPTQNGLHDLSKGEKTIWYSLTMLNQDNWDTHVMMGHGCGYAFDYSPIANKILEIGLAASPPTMYRNLIAVELGITNTEFLKAIYNHADDTTSLNLLEMYEIQYRMMHFYNANRDGGDGTMACANYDQMPSKSSDIFDPLNYYLLDQMENQY